MDYLGYLFYGFLYLTSKTFRAKKRLEWENTSVMFKIYEIGMWVSISLATVALIVIALIIGQSSS